MPKGFPWLAVIGLLLLLAAYPLSIGPAAWLPLTVFYSPLVWIANQNESLETVLSNYIEWWAEP